jgi:GNAT superfamily N-acetyltransferase
MTTGSSFSIRSAQSEDVATVLDLIKGLADYEKLAPEVVATEETLRATLFGEHRYAEVLLAEEGGGCVGFALFFHNYSTFLGAPGIYLEDLFVKPAARGRGIGKGLMEAVAGLAVARNCGRMEWSVLNWNQPAIEFYERFGAGPMQGWTVYRLTGEALQARGIATVNP